jgi:hypothetical protein
MVQSTGRPHVVEGLRLVALVGRGGEGEVWEARDSRGRRRALKLVRPDCLAPPDEAVARGRLLVRIDHSALVRVHRSGVLSGWSDDPGEDGDAERELEGYGFVEMDFIDGASLSGAEADPDVLERLSPLAEALDLLHEGHWSGGVPMIHRDIKPANIVEDADGRFVLVDPSTLRGVDTGQLTRIGTPVFCAPEVMLGDVTPAADVYSFAATIVALATGRRGLDLAEVLRDPNAFDLPPGVRQALSPDPARRPMSCRAVLEQGLVVDAPREVTRMLPPLPTWGEAWNGRVGAGAGAGPPGPVGGTWIDAGGGAVAGAAAGGVAWPAPPQAGPGQGGPGQGGGWGGQWPAQSQPRQGPPPPEQQAWGAPAAPPAPSRPVLGWLALAVALAAVPGVTRWMGVAPGMRLPLDLAAIGGHVFAIIVSGQSPLAAALPPLAWSVLIADRLGATRRRRAWVATMLLLPFTALAAVPLAALLPDLLPTAADPYVVAVLPQNDANILGLLGAALAVLAVLAARAEEGTGVVLRLAALPQWIVGAGVAVAVCLVLSVPGLLIGRASALLRSAGLIASGLIEVALPPRAAEVPAGWTPGPLEVPRTG